MGNDPGKKPALTDQIDELENLVNKKSMQSRVSVVGDQVIPILDELVIADEDEYDENDNIFEPDNPRYDQLVEQVEEKLSHELDEIMNLLKGNLKDSILQELQEKIKKDSKNESNE